MDKKAILVSYYDWYEHRMSKIGNVLLENGYDVSYYISDFDHLAKQKIKKYQDKNVYLVNVPTYKKNISLKRMYSLREFSKKIGKMLSKEKPDIVYCIIPPNSLVKSVIKSKHTYKVLFDIIDLWPESMPIDRFKNNIFFKKWQELRDNYITEADYVITECDLYRERLKNIIECEKSKTIYLTRNLSNYFSHPHLDKKHVNLCYLGSINNIIDIEAINGLIISLSQYKPVNFHIIGKGENKDKLIESAKKASAAVFDHGVIYNKDEKQKVFDYCHYGLNIYKTNTSIGLTIKSIDYFENGLPIINSIGSDTEYLVSNYKCGYNLKDINYKELANSYDNNLRNNSRKVFEENFTDDILKTRISEIIKQLEQVM